MNVSILEIILFVIFFQLVVFSIFLLINHKKNPSNFFLSIHMFSQAMGTLQVICFIQSSFFIEKLPSLYFVGYPFIYLWGPTFYLFIKFAAHKNNVWHKKEIVHFVPFFLVSLYLVITFFWAGSVEQKILLETRQYTFFKYLLFSDITVRVQVIAYIVLSIKLLANLKRKIKENYSSVSQTNWGWVKFMVLGFSVSFLVTLPAVIYSYIYPDFNNYKFFSFLMIPYFCYFNIIFFKAWMSPEIFSGIPEPAKYKYSKLTKSEADKLISKLNLHIEKEKPFLVSDFSLYQLAEAIEITPRILSQILNEYFGQNFYDYVNKLRIEESKKILADPAKNKTVLEILYEVGFNSKSAFNTAFKKTTGLTPTQFKKQFAE